MPLSRVSRDSRNRGAGPVRTIGVAMKEQWKEIEGYEGRYLISDHGRVKSLLRGEQILKLGHAIGGLNAVLAKKGYGQSVGKIYW